jgi:hypothetical protein
MRADENAAEAKKKATKAFYPEFMNENGFDLLDVRESAETAVSKRERMEEDVEEDNRKTERWQPFKTP